MKLINLLKEIIVKPSGAPIPPEVKNKIDHIIANQLPKDIEQQREDIGDPFTMVNDKGEDLLFDFIIDHMIASHHEILKGGQEILVSHSNRELVKEEDILDYLEENPGLKRYLDNLIWKYCMETVDINAIKQAAYKKYTDGIESSKWLPHPDEWFLTVFKDRVQNQGWLEPFVDFYDAVWDPEFPIYLYSALLKSDLP